jgi:hypothetical protein
VWSPCVHMSKAFWVSLDESEVDLISCTMSLSSTKVKADMSPDGSPEVEMLIPQLLARRLSRMGELTMTQIMGPAPFP